MKIARRLQPNLDGSGQRMKKPNETIVIGTAVCKLKPLPLAGDILNQCNVPFFGDVDCD